jgi:hypothetical protein
VNAEVVEMPFVSARRIVRNSQVVIPPTELGHHGWRLVSASLFCHPLTLPIHLSGAIKPVFGLPNQQWLNRIFRPTKAKSTA